MKYVSVCSGIEAATVAWHPLGWVPVMFAEIEPFPCAVLKHHYPDVPLVGDFTQLILNPPDADLLVGGTPCQAFSVAGKRLSLEDYRGNLSLAFADLFHAGDYRWAVWENVPGVLSTKDNAFGCLLGRLVGADAPLLPGKGNKWTNAGVVSGPLATAAWRVLDAQYFGVAQRRRRVFVCVSRSAGNWAAATALLPVGESVSGHPPTRRQAGEGLARTFETGPSGGRVSDVSATLDAKAKDGPRRNQQATAILAYPINTQIATRHEALGEGTGFGIGDPGDPAFTLQAGHSHGVFAPDREVMGTITSRMLNSLGARDVEEGAVVLGSDIVGALDTECGFNKATDQTVRNGNDMAVPDRLVESVTGDITHALKAEGSDGSEDGTGRGVPIIAMRQREGKPLGEQGSFAPSGLSLTLAANTNDQTIFAPVVAVRTAQTSANGHGISENVAHTLDQVQGQAVSGVALRPRRLTPRECERLQGFPDDYTLIPKDTPMSHIRREKLDMDYVKYLHRGGRLTFEQCMNAASDGPRYKALGNSMAVPVMRWIGRQIQRVEAQCVTP